MALACKADSGPAGQRHTGQERTEQLMESQFQLGHHSRVSLGLEQRNLPQLRQCGFREADGASSASKKDASVARTACSNNSHQSVLRMPPTISATKTNTSKPQGDAVGSTCKRRKSRFPFNVQARPQSGGGCFCARAVTAAFRAGMSPHAACTGSSLPPLRPRSIAPRKAPSSKSLAKMGFPK